MRVNYRELKQRIGLRDLLNRIGWKNTEGRGDQLRGPCPLPACRYQQSNAGREGAERAFSIHAAKNVYRCFHCGSKGNALDFWRSYRNTTLNQAAIELHQILAISNHTPISNQPGKLQPSSSQSTKMADS
jgi:hypothetical protein